ncbi:MAG: hypothetical protein DHS20C14_21910 [Phycisphaeraceae bacterium]|nr:MAG: hypothetical protein DHS20C14_21910 [Phycisphaeraceae bacterium]
MRVLLIVDAPFAQRERTLVARLGLSLADEGDRVHVALPEGMGSLSGIELLGDPLGFRAEGLMLTRSIRARHLVQRIEERTPGETPDVVHVFGGSLWSFGVEVATQLGAAAVLEVWRSGLCDRAKAFRASPDTPLLYLAPDRTIERRILSESPGASVRLARWGGHVPGSPARPLANPATPSIMILGNGNDPESFRAAFEGVARLADAGHTPMMFIDSDGARKAGIWKRARELKVLDRVTLIDKMEDRRDLVLRGDIVVHPERLHEHRTIVLDAMGAGVPVIAGADPDIEALIDARTCVVVAQPTADVWSHALGMMLDDPEGARALGASAREYIRDGRKFSAYAAAAHDAYEWLTSADAVPFAGRAV